MDVMCKLMLEFAKVDGKEIHENKYDHQRYKSKHFKVGDKIKACVGNAGHAYFGIIKCMKEGSLIDALCDNGKDDFDIGNNLSWHLTSSD